MIYLVTYTVKDPDGVERTHHDKYDESVPIKVIKDSLKHRGATNVSINMLKEGKVRA